MPLRKNGCLGKIVAAVFTSIVIPILINVGTQTVTEWQDAAGLTPAAVRPAPSNDWDRPALQAAAPRVRETPSAKRFDPWRRVLDSISR